MSKNKSSQDIAKENIAKLRHWLADNPTIPIYHGNANKSEICRIHGITKSTIGSNKHLRDIFDEIEQIAAIQQRNTGNHLVATTQACPEDIRTLLKEKDDLIKWLRKELSKAQASNELLQQESATEELLVLTGRYVSPATKSQSDTGSTDKDGG